MVSSGLRKPPERNILGRLMYPPKGQHWKYKQENVDKMTKAGRIRIAENKGFKNVIEFIAFNSRELFGYKPRYYKSYIKWNR